MEITARIYRVLPFFVIPLAAFCLVKVCYLGLEYYMTGQISKYLAQDRLRIEQDGSVGPDEQREREYDYQIILTRNLFGPLPEKEDNGENYGVSLNVTDLGIVLMGTVQGRESSNRAIILDKASHSQDLYGVGDVIQGAKIQDIQRGKVIIALDGRFEMLDMSEAAKMRKSSRARKLKSRASQKLQRPRRAAVAPMTEGDPGAPEADDTVQDLSEERQDIQEDIERRLVRPRVIQPSRRIVPRQE